MEARIERIECWVLRAPIEEPVANAFGAMTNRPAVFLRISARSEERRVGKECEVPCRSRWSPYH